MSSKVRFLMCPPDQYDVDYVINPWMEGNVHKPSRKSAAGQWLALHELLRQEAEVETIRPIAGLPDMVFTANAGLALGRKFILSRFLHRERQGEEPHFKNWFAQNGFKVLDLPPDLPFEGAGDALLDREGACLRW
jgi:N-dimethylarginine dimethylaminohydrolase